MAKKRRILIAGDKRFNMINNYLTADEKGSITPENAVATEINVTIEKIKSLISASSIIKNGTVKLVLNEKIEAYKDCSESLLKISQLMNQFLLDNGEEK